MIRRNWQTKRSARSQIARFRQKNHRVAFQARNDLQHSAQVQSAKNAATNREVERLMNSLKSLFGF